MKDGRAVKLAFAAYAGGWDEHPLSVIPRVKALGFDGIEIGVGVDRPRNQLTIRRALEDAGLFVVCGTGYPPGLDPLSDSSSARTGAAAYLKACAKSAARVGATCLAGFTHSTIARPPLGADRRRLIGRSASVLRDAARYAAGFGVTIVVETINRYESCIVNTAAEAVALCELTGEPNVGVHLDTFHMMIEEEDFRRAIRTALPRLRHFHFAENTRGLLGSGLTPWREIIATLVRGRYRGTIAIEAFEDASPAFRHALCLWREPEGTTAERIAQGLQYCRRIERGI
jgi:D-psicose/D-tagatose/L-ribulose 3-epimerase